MWLKDIDFVKDRERNYNIRRVLFLRNITFFVFFIIFSIFSIITLSEYYEATLYKDDFNTIKKHNLWYNIYDKNWDIQKIVFYNDKWFENDLIVGFIDNNIFFEDKIKDKDMIKYFSLGNNLSYYSLDDIVLTKDSININTLKDFNILEIWRDEKNFIILYNIHNKKDKITDKTITYCFNINNLNFLEENIDKTKRYCLLNKEKNKTFSFINYMEKYFLVFFDNNIFIYSLEKEDIIGIFYNKDNFIQKMQVKNNNDIDLFFWKNEKKVLRYNLIDYHLKELIKQDNKRVNVDKLILTKIF